MRTPLFENLGAALKPIIYFLLIVAVWAGLYLPNLGIPAFSGMEGLRYAVAKEMLVHRDWVHLYLNGDPYYNKPPLTMWLIAPMIGRFDQIDEFSARLPFALSMLAMAMLIFLVVSRWVTMERAMIVALMPLTSVGALRFGRACEIDGLFAVFFIVAVLFWSDIWLSQVNRRKASIVLGIAIGLGGLCKGPLILALFAVFFALVALHARDWRRTPIIAVALGAAIPLLWVGAIYASGLGNDAFATWTHEMAMRFDRHVVPVGEPPWHAQVMWGMMLTLPWSLLYPFLYLPNFLPKDRVMGALLRGGRDAGLLCFLGIITMSGLQYQYLVPVGMLMALEIGLAAVVTPQSIRPALVYGLRFLTVAAALLLTVMSAAAVTFLDAGIGIAAGIAGLLLGLVLIRRSPHPRTAAEELKYSIAGVVGAAVLAIIVVIPPLNAVNQDRDIGQKVSAIVPLGEKVYCPFSIDNMAAYIKRPVLIYVPDVQRNYLYAIIRESDLANFRQSKTLAVQDVMPFHYRTGWRREATTIHLVLLTMRDTTQTIDPDEVRSYIQS